MASEVTSPVLERGREGRAGLGAGVGSGLVGGFGAGHAGSGSRSGHLGKAGSAQGRHDGSTCDSEEFLYLTFSKSSKPQTLRWGNCLDALCDRNSPKKTARVRNQCQVFVTVC